MFENGKYRIGQAGPEFSDGSMVAHIRLLLAVTALLTIFNEWPGSGGRMTVIVFTAYTVHTAVLSILALRRQPYASGRSIHWLDVAWYAVMVLSTGSSQSIFFPFFFFAILTASFRWGFDEGARVTVASALLYFATGTVGKPVDFLSALLLRTTFLLALGYMIAYWGQSEMALRRRLALLRDVSKLSNPRFGVDHTVTSVMRKTQDFFGADSCVLVQRTGDSEQCSYRAVRQEVPDDIARAQQVDMQAMAPLLDFAKDHPVVYFRPELPGLAFMAGWHMHESACNRWRIGSGAEGDCVADLLRSRYFIAAPVVLRGGEGRMFVMRSRGGFTRGDALFLAQISAQVFPVIENIELLDRIASEAASVERKKIAHDLHDTVIQPYIGLQIGLHALCRKTRPDDPLSADLARLNDMTSQVISDLRRYAGRFHNSAPHGESVFLDNLRRQAEQVRKFYGIDISISVDGSFTVSDRLAAEVHHVVSEGLSNIRKHTTSRRGAIRLTCIAGWLNIQIENESFNMQPLDFTPRSIASRAAALGGRAEVLRASGGNTLVHVEIPV
jgi:signal transduction histidine kinase